MPHYGFLTKTRTNLEYLEIEAGSYLDYVIIGEGVELAEGITLGKEVYFLTD